MKKPELSLETIKRELKKMDKELDLDSEAGQAAIMLLSALQFGPKIKNIANFMGVKMKDIRKFYENARLNGIFTSNKVRANWFDKDGGVEFWMDVNCCLGLMKRIMKKGKA